MTTLRITEIFYSLQGESTFVGLPTVFVRLTGCPLRCTYCDTAYAFTGGETITLTEILQKVDSYKTEYVTVTGGEPLAQKACLDLLSALCDRGKTVSLETSGALSVADVDPRVIKILDIKTPSSSEMQRNDYQNLFYLAQKDQIKFVIGSREDFDFSVDTIKKYQLNEKVATILFSPIYKILSPTQLAEWIIAEQLNVRLQIQLHKLLWGEEQGR